MKLVPFSDIKKITILVLLFGFASPQLAFSEIMNHMSPGNSTEQLKVQSPWISHAPRVAKTHAGYLTLINMTKKPRSIIGASSIDYERVEIHSSRVQDGVATMEKLAQVEIPMGGVAMFKPGGIHLMLIKPKRKISLNDSVKLVLSFDDGTLLTISAKVQKTASGKGMMEHHKHSM